MLRRRSNRDPEEPQRLPLPDQVTLVLQGGGALGAYQAGVFEALSATEIPIDWIAGISIGAINAAVIAGNPPERRVPRLRALWETLTSGGIFPSMGSPQPNSASHLMWAAYDATVGVQGFFNPRWIPPFLAWPDTLASISWYDSAPLAKTLDELVDWDLLNDGPTRLSVGAVNVKTGNFHYFDTVRDRLDARHILASGALPPGLPPVEIDGHWWWDGGLVSNTPLAYALEHQQTDMLVFQVDLFPARGEMPRNIFEAYAREKDIRYSSRTRQVTDTLIAQRKERELVRRVLDKLPPDLLADPDVERLSRISADYAVNIAHLIYRKQGWESWASDFEFSRAAMDAHWNAGQEAVAQTLKRDSVLAENIRDCRTAAFDLTNGKEAEQ